MSWGLYFAFLLASGTLILIPGPNVGLIVSNSLRHGALAGLSTVLGTTLGIALQLTVVCAGLSPFLMLFTEWFEWVRWMGVAYLIYLGILQFAGASEEQAPDKSIGPKSGRWVAQGLFIALANPKTMLFFAAFLPQFIDPGHPAGLQWFLLSLSFTGMAFVLDSGYALLAGKVQSSMSHPGARKWFRRFSGSILIGAGLGLGLARGK